MPRLLVFDLPHGLRAFIFFGDHGFPHVHFYKGTPKDHEAHAKIRIDQIELIECHGFNKKTINRILKLVEYRQQELLDEWEKAQEN